MRIHVGVHAIVRENNGDGRRRQFGGALDLSDLIHVASFGGNIDVNMATDAVGGEPGEPFEISGLDGQDERGLDG